MPRFGTSPATSGIGIAQPVRAATGSSGGFTPGRKTFVQPPATRVPTSSPPVGSQQLVQGYGVNRARLGILKRKLASTHPSRARLRRLIQSFRLGATGRTLGNIAKKKFRMRFNSQRKRHALHRTSVPGLARFAPGSKLQAKLRSRLGSLR